MAPTTQVEMTNDETMALLIRQNRSQADRVLREMGYSVEEWERHHNAPAAVENGRAAVAEPAPAPLNPVDAY